MKDLFTKLYRKGEPVRLLGVRFSQLIPFTMQMNLFDNNAEKLNLYKAVDDIKNQFGNKAILKAAASSLAEGNNRNTIRNNKKKSAD